MADKSITEPKVFDLPRFVDDRGSLDQVFNDDLPFPVKRVYCTRSHRGVVRAFHGHKKEWKAFYVTHGIVKFVAFKMGDEKAKNMKEKMAEFTLGENKPQILVMPNGYYHGFSALTESTSVVILSNMSLKESVDDDFRLSPQEHMKSFEVRHR